jgi:hypothetical protein
MQNYEHSLLLRAADIAAEPPANHSGHAGGAIQFALRLPEIVSGILAHLLPANSSCESDDHDSDTGVSVASGGPEVCHDDDDDATTAASSRSDLFAAALVNRTWCAAALPLLWAHPTEEALRDDAVTTFARRAWYASHIRTVHISRRSPLWLALAGPDENISHEAGPIAGSDHEGSTGALRLPRLTALHVEQHWDDDEGPPRLPGVNGALIHQAPLVQYITPGLEELSCHLTDEVVDRLELHRQLSLTQERVAESDRTTG